MDVLDVVEAHREEGEDLEEDEDSLVDEEEEDAVEDSHEVVDVVEVDTKNRGDKR